MTSLHRRICYPGYGIRTANLLFLPRDAFCICRRVKQHTKLNHLPEDLWGGGWFMPLAQIAMLELFLRSSHFQVRFKLHIFYLGVTSLHFPMHVIPRSSKHVQCIFKALKGVTFLQEGVLFAWSASTSMHRLAKTTRFPRIKQSNNK